MRRIAGRGARFESLELRALLSGLGWDASASPNAAAETRWEVNNANAADTVNVNQLRGGELLGLGLTGSGVTVGVYDEGAVLASHVEFKDVTTGVSRVISGGTTDPAMAAQHSTHVAATIAAHGISVLGGNALARGMADHVQILSSGIDLDGSPWRDDFAAGLIDLSNHSYSERAGWFKATIDWNESNFDFHGDPGTYETWYGYRNSSPIEDHKFGKYRQFSRDTDEILYDYPNLLSVWAAGNDRIDEFKGVPHADAYVAYLNGPLSGVNYTTAGFYVLNHDPPGCATCAPPRDGGVDGFDTLPPTHVAKNSLVVGAVEDIVTGTQGFSQGDVVLADFSSIGPTDDGRIKPDVVANGVEVLSASNESTTAYFSQSGTSFSAPNTTGAAALLLEHYRNLYAGADPRSATQKGYIIHTARDAGNTGPDYKFGWGVVDAAAAATFLSSAASGSASNKLFQATYVDAGAGVPEWTTSIAINGASSLKGTMVWTNPEAGVTFGTTVDTATPKLINDLDFWITGPNGASTIFRPWTLNPSSPNANAVRTAKNTRDNVEQVLIDLPAAGSYVVHVSHSGVATTLTQNFSLLISADATPPRIIDAAVARAGVPEYWFSAVDPDTGAIRVGNGLRQLKTVNIGGANQIKIKFNETLATTGNLAIGQDDLTLYRASSTGTNVAVTGFSWDAVNMIATWTIDSTPSGGQLLLGQFTILLSSAIADAAGNRLAGAWSNPSALDNVASDVFPSGDEPQTGEIIAGKDFHFRITLLPGDADRDNAIELDDLNAVRNNFGTGTTWAQGNMDGDSSTDLDDLNLIRDSFGLAFTSWPTGALYMTGGGGNYGEEVLWLALRDLYQERRDGRRDLSRFDGLFDWEMLGDEKFWDELLAGLRN